MKKFFSKKLLVEIFQTILGSFIMALGTSLFLLPNQLSSGGFSGIATITYYLLNLPMGTIILALNIPLFIIAFFKIGKTFLLKAVAGTISLSYFIDCTDKLKPLTQDRLLACIYGGIIIGIGTAIILRAEGSTGGTELLTNIINKYKPGHKTSSLIVILDTIIVGLNVFLFKEIEIGLYSAISIYIMGKILDIFFEGIDFAKMLLIISPKWEQISDAINKELRRGSTALYGKGMYKKQEKNILLCVMSRAEIREARKIIEKIDSSAFIVITTAREVYGEGFKEV